MDVTKSTEQLVGVDVTNKRQQFDIQTHRPLLDDGGYSTIFATEYAPSAEDQLSVENSTV